MSARIQNTGTGEKIFTIANLAGGLNKKASVYDLADDEAAGLVNFIFTETGILKIRPGYVKYNSYPLANPIYSMYRFYKANGTDKYFIITSGSSIYKDTSGTFDALTCNETITANKRFQFAVFNDNLYMTNGTNKPLAWSGTGNIRQMGITAPNAGTAALGSAGLCTNGAHSIRITYYNSTDDVESAHYSLGSVTVSSNKKIELTNLAASSDVQVDKIRIYMTDAGGTTYYKVAEQVDTTTTYTINLSDTTLKANASYSCSDHDDPPSDADFICVAGRKVYLYNNSSHPSRLYWSETNEPESFGDIDTNINWRDINLNDGDVGTGMIYWNNYLYLFKNNSTWVLTDPTDPANSNLENVSPTIGCVSPYSIASGMFQRPLDIPGSDYILVDGIILNTRFGVMGFDGKQFWPLSERVEPILDSLYETNIKELVGFFNNNKYYLAYTPQKGTVTEGGFVTFNQFTTDSGSENKDATWVMAAEYNSQISNHDPSNYENNIDARINLDKTSSNNKNINVKVHIEWKKEQHNTAHIEEYKNQPIMYEIFFSYNSGTSWISKGTFKKYPNEELFGKHISYRISRYVKPEEAISDYTHTFYDSAVTNVRLDYFWNHYPTENIADYVRLESVEYWYDYTAAVIGTDVVNNRVLYYDTLHNAWSELRGIKAASFCAWNGSGDQREEFFGGSKLGYVYRMNVGASDDSNEIFALYQSKHFDCKDRSRKKRFHQLNFNTDIFNSTIHLDVFIDRTQRTSWKTLLLPKNTDTTYWKEKYFGEFTWDRVINMINKTFRLPTTSLGRFIGFQLWTSSKEPLAIQDYSIKYVTRESMN